MTEDLSDKQLRADVEDYIKQLSQNKNHVTKTGEVDGRRYEFQLIVEEAESE